MPGYGEENKDQNIKGFKTETPKSGFVEEGGRAQWINPPGFSEVKLDSFASYEASAGEGKIGHKDVDTIQFSGGGGELHYEFDAETIEYMQTLFHNPASSTIAAHDNEDKTFGGGIKNEFEIAVGFGALFGVQGEYEVHFGSVEVHHRML